VRVGRTGSSHGPSPARVGRHRPDPGGAAVIWPRMGPSRRLSRRPGPCHSPSCRTPP